MSATNPTGPVQLRTRVVGAALAVLLLAGPAFSQTVYKSVDESGETVYSDHPVPGAPQSEAVDITPAPSDEAVEQARQRVTATSQLADQLAEQRGKKQQQQRKAAEKTRSPPAPPRQAQPDSPYYGYPHHPRPPGHHPPPNYPYEWQGPGDHPAFRPPSPRRGPPPRPVPLPAAAGVVNPVR